MNVVISSLVISTAASANTLYLKQASNGKYMTVNSSNELVASTTDSSLAQEFEKVSYGGGFFIRAVGAPRNGKYSVEPSGSNRQELDVSAKADAEVFAEYSCSENKVYMQSATTSGTLKVESNDKLGNGSGRDLRKLGKRIWTVFAQIHALTSYAYLKMQWDGPNRKVRAIMNESPTSSSSFSVEFDVTPGTNPIDYVILQEDNTLTVTVSSGSESETKSMTFGQSFDDKNGNFVTLSNSWDNQKYYFKAGNYAQAKHADHDGIFVVKYTDLEVYHSIMTTGSL